MFHVVEIALVAIALDVAASSLSSPLSEWSIGATAVQATPSLGERAATFLLGYVAFFPAFLLAMTSLAVATTAAFGSPSLLLLYRRYRSWESPTVVLHGRTNRFHRSLVFGLGLTAALLALTASRQLHLTGNHLPAVLFVGALLVFAVLSTLLLAVWLIQLRNPSDVVREVHGMAHDVIAEITAGHPDAHLSRLIRWRGVASPYRCRYQEQEDLKQSVFALAEVGARSLTDRQRFASREAVRALGTVADSFRRRRSWVAPEWTSLWTRDGERTEEAEDWFERVLVEAFESVLLAAIGFRYVSVTSDAGRELKRLGLALTWRRSRRSDYALRRLLAAVENCVDEAVDAKDVEAMHLLLPLAYRMLAAVSRPPFRSEPVFARIHERSTGMAYRAVVTGDIAALRALLAMLKQLSTSRPSAQGVVSASVLDLAAVALASRSYGAASVLIDWFITPPGTSSASAMTPRLFEEAVSSHPLGGRRMCNYVPEYVRPEYYQLSVLLTAARIRQIHTTVTLELQADVRSYVASLPDRLARAKLVCDRIGPAVALSTDELRDWAKELAHFV
jgi:hypothetical protein